MKTLFTFLAVFLFSFFIQAQGTLNTGLVAYYPFSGNAGDSSGFSNHGTVYSGTTLTNDRNNNSNKAYNFNGGTSAYINIPSSTSLNTNAMNNICISVWFRFSGSTTQKRIYNIQDGSNRNYDLAYDYTSQKLQYTNYNISGNAVFFTSKAVLQSNIWYHALMRIDSLNSSQLFINGILDTFSTNTIVKPISPTISIGRHLVNNLNFQGDIDELRIYNRYLTNSEIQQLAEILPNANPVAYYPFSGNAGDSSGFNNHGTAYSGATLTLDRLSNSNKAYNFSGGTTAYINVPSSSSLNTNTMNNISVSLWFRAIGTATPTRRIFDFQDASGKTYEFGYDYSAQKVLYFNWNGVSSSVYFTSKNIVPLNVWNHAVIRIDSLNNTQLFINGVLDTFSTNAIVKPVSPSFSIGRQLTNNWNFQGDIDELRIYNRYVTNAEIMQLANAISYTNYYSKSTGALNTLSTWGTNTDGTGTAPLSFDSSQTRYYVVNNSAPSISANWTVNGTNTAIVFGDGTNSYNLSIPTSNTITCDSVFVRNAITLTVQGTLASNKVASENTSTVQFIGSSAQNIPQGLYSNLTVSASTKTLLGNVQVSNILTMLNHINSGIYTLTLGTSPSQTGTLTRSAGNIVGTFVRWFAASTGSGSTGLFPIGQSTITYNPIQFDFTTAPSAGGTLTTQFIATNPGTTGLPLFDGIQYIDKAGQNGYWKVVAGNGLTGGTYTVTATATSFWGVSSYTELRLIRRTTGGAWSLTGTAIATTGNNAAPILSRTGLTVLGGEFGVGGDITVNPLPVKWLSIDGKKVNENTVQIIWQTAAEMNNDYFEVERSCDGSQFITIGKVKGNGTINAVSSYAFVDNNSSIANCPLSNLFYRIKQADINGKFDYSDIVKVNFSKSFETINVFPNPATNEISLTTKGEIRIFNVFGQEIYSGSSNKIDVSHWAKGVYYLNIESEGNKLSKKFIVQ